MGLRASFFCFYVEQSLPLIKVLLLLLKLKGASLSSIPFHSMPFPFSGSGGVKRSNSSASKFGAFFVGGGGGFWAEKAASNAGVGFFLTALAGLALAAALFYTTR